MSTWEQVKHITKFELTRNVVTPLLSILYAGALLIVFVSERSFDQSILIDIIFLALFSGSFTFFAKTDAFKPQVINEQIHTTYPIVFLQHLPIAHQAIINSRIIIHNVYNVVMQCFFIIPLYIFSPVFHALMPVQTFIIFLIVWLSLGVCASGFTAADEAGKTVSNRTFTKSIFQIILIGIVIFILYKFTPFSILGGSVYIVSNWPAIAVVGAIVFGSSGVIYGKAKMKRTLKTMDYM